MPIISALPVLPTGSSVSFLSGGAGNRTTSVGTGGTLSSTWTHDIITSGSSVVALSAVEYWYEVGGTLTVGVTYDGVSMTSAGAITTTAGSPSIIFATALFYLFNPTSGSQSAIASLTGSALKYLCQGSSVAYGGASSVSAPTTLASTSSTTPSITLTSTASSRVVAAFDRVRTSTTSITGETGTSRYYNGGQISPVTAGVTAEYIFLSLQDQLGAASSTIGVTAATGTSRGIAVSINP